jgi:hypothetical protein
MSPHTYVTFLLKPIKENRKEKESGIVQVR